MLLDGDTVEAFLSLEALVSNPPLPSPAQTEPSVSQKRVLENWHVIFVAEVDNPGDVTNFLRR